MSPELMSRVSTQHQVDVSDVSDVSTTYVTLASDGDQKVTGVLVSFVADTRNTRLSFKTLTQDACSLIDVIYRVNRRVTVSLVTDGSSIDVERCQCHELVLDKVSIKRDQKNDTCLVHVRLLPRD